MSVLSCARNGCENIMCGRHSHRHGYICDECFEELVAHGAGQDICDFMDSRKDTFPDYDDEARAMFMKVFTLN